MKRKTKRFIAGVLSGVAATVIIGVAYDYQTNKNNGQEGSNGKSVTEYATDEIYNHFIASDFEKLSDNEKITRTLIDSKDNWTSDKEVLYFFRQLLIQGKEDAKDYIAVNNDGTRVLSKDAQNKINELIYIVDHFVLSTKPFDKPYKGKMYKDLPEDIRKEIITVGNGLYYILKNGYPKEEEFLVETGNNVKTMAAYWVGTRK